ncbi:DUF2786 domain-containing protein [Desulfuromonas acetoxidans]|uniref:Uncharacterized protein n=1 Tax=Desulfuromonas acetoxidans (strain DSM 684 / 11070) TaxID=281689 RepID=Q1K057_DESA6|nr:DUF2786 domain-containing protein [Desulfuromonas acetoxidans]EAT16084.1 conserved hypothetical protein [Desulfuromonas acetoxidans DSM 684]MBF0646900.1 DUF2786 domain-containing protein [Desulfuromonas acetoxidans]NVD26177.1 DUF2786 domain-containing protein [Desulfuromonas acetoxidans]NVE18011.1 DUF2786 domain-containing protein [Desulfuromonas acetoxidans]
MNQDHVEKIKKLLALSKSSNAHEAALALQRAQELMQKHNVTMTYVRLSDVKEAKTRIGKVKNPAIHIKWLARMVADAFGCRLLLVTEYVGFYGWFSSAQFIGIDSAAELSSYAFDVLHRQLERDRKHHLTTLKRCKRATKVRRADAFCRAWVSMAASKVVDLAPKQEQQDAITQWIETNHGESLVEDTNRKHKKARRDDSGSVIAGLQAGDQAQLHAGMTGEDRLRLQ